jgi:enamine deaminase RidA (YjgF/YER057c/UK114 family)
VAHQRLRRFDSGSLYPASAGGEMSMAVKAGPEIFLRGLTGLDLDGRFVGIGDAAAQAEQAMRNVKLLLEEAGSQMAHICKITTYVTDRAYREPVHQVIGRYLGDIAPVGTGLIVNGLARPEMLVAIDIDAVIPGASA